MPQEQMKIERLRTDDGDVVLGRLLTEEQLQKCYENLNVNKTVEFNLSNAISSVNSGAKVAISNTVSAKKSLVNK